MHAAVLFLHLFKDIAGFQLNFMNFYDFMPSGTPVDISPYKKVLALRDECP